MVVDFFLTDWIISQRRSTEPPFSCHFLKELWGMGRSRSGFLESGKNVFSVSRNPVARWRWRAGLPDFFQDLSTAAPGPSES